MASNCEGSFHSCCPSRGVSSKSASMSAPAAMLHCVSTDSCLYDLYDQLSTSCYCVTYTLCRSACNPQATRGGSRDACAHLCTAHNADGYVMTCKLLTSIHSASFHLHFLKSPSSLLHFVRGQIYALDILDLHFDAALPLKVSFVSNCESTQSDGINLSVSPFPYIATSSAG